MTHFVDFDDCVASLRKIFENSDTYSPSPVHRGRKVKDETAPILHNIEGNIENLLDTHVEIHKVLETFDEKLVKVLG